MFPHFFICRARSLTTVSDTVSHLVCVYVFPFHFSMIISCENAIKALLPLSLIYHVRNLYTNILDMGICYSVFGFMTSHQFDFSDDVL